jgi:peptide/nickel transport system permease protein
VFYKKLLYLAGMLLLISAISFLAISLAPNSFFSAGGLNPNMTPQTIEHLKAVYGLDKPLFEQYISWVYHLVQLDFGISFVSGKEVSTVIYERIPITLVINGVTLVVVFFLSIYLGLQAAFNQNTIIDKTIKQFALFSFSVPSFYLALMLILVFAVYLEWFPIAGVHSINVGEGLSYYLDMAWHLFLPIFVMIVVSIGSFSMYVRSLTIDILKSDYIFFAKARGLRQEEITKYYVLPNLLPPIVTLLGLSLPGLLGGSVILESIFGIEGMGQLFFQSALSRDYPVIMGILMITAFLTLLGNMIADLILLKLNPFTTA